jgi:type III secretory pathway component EscV
MAVLYEASVLYSNALVPTAVLLEPMVEFAKVAKPNALLFSPVVLLSNALLPYFVFVFVFVAIVYYGNRLKKRKKIEKNHKQNKTKEKMWFI